MGGTRVFVTVRETNGRSIYINDGELAQRFVDGLLRYSIEDEFECSWDRETASISAAAEATVSVLVESRASPSASTNLNSPR